jgi:hypothetical protein
MLRGGGQERFCDAPHDAPLGFRLCAIQERKPLIDDCERDEQRERDYVRHGPPPNRSPGE